MIFSNPFTARAADKPEGPLPASVKTAIFAAGCFWCVEKDFEHHDGVIKAISGYAGGTMENPTYKNHEGYVEAVEIYYDADKLNYKDLLEIYWANVDPLDSRGQFCDKGDAYKAAIFYDSDTEEKLAKQSLSKVSSLLQTDDVTTKVVPKTTFYTAEEYHQDYYRKNPNRYEYYRWRCGRDRRLNDLWGNQALKRVKIF